MSLVIGDTPEKLGSCLAANAMIVDGKIVTRDDYRAMAAQVEALRQVINEYKKCRVSAQLAINEIVHRDSKTPQQHLANLRAEAGRAGFIACHDVDKIVPVNDESVQTLADRYAEQIRKGEVK